MIAMNEKLLEAYKQFLDFRTAISMQVKPDKITQYDWYKLPDKMSPIWMPYVMMLDEYRVGIANSINELLKYICSLEAWKNVIKDMEDDNKLFIIDEFVAPVAILSISMPYVMRSRFIYSLVHLCHQCNRIKERKWVDNLPEEKEISMNVTDKYCKKWKEYRKLKLALEKVANKQFANDTKDFRNKYNHRYSLGIELGVTEFVKREVVGKAVRYKIGYTAPLKINELLPILQKQHEHCLKAFSKYQDLVNEQILEIGKE